jgi:hypothetical protein
VTGSSRTSIHCLAEGKVLQRVRGLAFHSVWLGGAVAIALCNAQRSASSPVGSRRWQVLVLVPPWIGIVVTEQRIIPAILGFPMIETAGDEGGHGDQGHTECTESARSCTEKKNIMRFARVVSAACERTITCPRILAKEHGGRIPIWVVGRPPATRVMPEQRGTGDRLP